MTIDFRSDTVTKPTKGMLDAMMRAPVGDDVFGEDPSINELESLAASMFGMEAALFCPSGTMTNQLAIKCHTQPGDEVICDESAHVYQYEGGGIASNSGASVKLIYGDRGRISAAQVLAGINNNDDSHKAFTRLVCLENTSNRGGGSCYDMASIETIKEVCAENHLAFHLDGARLFNALISKNQTPLQFGAAFDSISICLSKGLGAPVGSVLLGKKDFIKKAHRHRKAFGGGMRQAGFLAAAGRYALENHVDRLTEDHTNAALLATAIAKKEFVEEMLPVETNILIFIVRKPHTARSIVQKMKDQGILGYAITPDRVRLVTHLDISQEMIYRSIEAINNL